MNADPELFNSPLTLSLSKGERLAQDRSVEGRVLWRASWLRETLLLSLLLALSLAACRSTVPSPSRPNVLLVTIDTWRADRLGAGVSPALDRLAASGVRFVAARTAAPLTLPSHATILTGLLPPAHGVRENGAGALRDAHPTIAALLKGAGYRTAAFVGAFVLDRRFGLAAGFDTYDDRIPRDPAVPDRLEAERPASAVVDATLAWLDSTESLARGTLHPAPGTDHAAPGTRHLAPGTERPRADDIHQAPFFVWIHLYDPHAPYAPPVAYRGRTKTPYDDEVAYADAEIQRVFDWLKTHAIADRPVADRTMIVVAGDHGEGLGDHGERTHGMLLYDSTLRVPLIVAAPGTAAAVRDEPVSLTDIAPTILRAAGVTPPQDMKGRDLLREVRLQPDLYSETEYPRVTGWSPLQALTDGRWKTIRVGSAAEVYDLQSDPQERHDVAATQESIAMAMSARMAAIRASASPGAAQRVSPEAQERLRALGYVASSGHAPADANAPNPAALIDAWNRFEDALGAVTARRKDAVALIEPLAAAHPESPVFQTTAARAWKDSGRLDHALAIYRTAARRWPTDAALLHDLAVAARDAAQSASSRSEGTALRDEAEKAERAAVALAPERAMAHNGLGLIAIDAGRLQEGADAFQRAVALDAGNASYAANLGNARRALGDRPGAEQAYGRAIDLDPRNTDAANGLGVLLVEAQRPAEAVAWFERALTGDPDFVEARLNLGIALQESGHSQRAADAYRQVLKSSTRFARERAAAAKLLAALRASR